MWRLWKWSLPVAIAIAVPLALIDLAFLSSNALKIPSGGWFPIIIGIAVFTLLTTWKTGRSILMLRLADGSLPLDDFIQSIQIDPPIRVPGTAVFLTSALNSVPNSLLHNLKHNKVLHERVVFLTIIPRDIPYVAVEDRYEVKPLGGGFFQLCAYYGFSEDADVPRLLEQCGRGGFTFVMMETSFFVSRESLIATGAPGMAKWRERLFVSMSKNATKASDYFGIPTNRVVELGTQVEI
jgi:KUP system potassium uptake protein